MKSRIVAILMIMALVFPLLIVVPIRVQADTDGDWSYAYEVMATGESGYAIWDYTGNAEILEVPGSLKGHGIKWIWSYAFYGCESLKHVTFARPIRRFFEGAFVNCVNLESIVLPDGAELDAFIFKGCKSLKDVTLPSDLKQIDYNTFQDCVSLTSMTFGENIYSIKSKAFAGCTGLKEIKFLGSMSIDADAFEGVTATVYYFKSHWPDERRQNYGGNLTWVQVNDYCFIEDENLVNKHIWYRYGGTDLSVRVKAPVEEVNYLMVPVDKNGSITQELFDPNNYTLTKVSDTEFILTLKAAYLETLPINQWGNTGHSGVSIYFKDGYRCGLSITLEKPVGPLVTEPPVTEPPVTEPPVTEPPVTEPPVTEPPVTEPPTTEPPATEPPVTEPPATEPSQTESQPTEPVTQPTEPATQPTEAVTQPTEPTTVPPTPAEKSGPELLMILGIAGALMIAAIAGIGWWRWRSRRS